MILNLEDHVIGGDIVVEYVGKNNQNFIFHPLSQRMRGRWTNRNVLLQSPEESKMNQLPDIPGLLIVVNIKQRVLKVVDPLGFPEHAETLRKANEIVENFFPAGRAWPTQVKDNLSETDLKSILWLIREFVDSNKFVVHTGQLPHRGEIFDMPGRLKLRWVAMGQVDAYASDDELVEIYESLKAKGIKCQPPRIAKQEAAAKA